MQKSFYITTLGCPKNTADSGHMEESLLQTGLIKGKNAESSDFHLINTCTFISTATEETIDTILSAAKVKKKRNQKLVVVGCFAERYPDAIREDIPEVDLSFGTGRFGDAGTILKEKFPSEFLEERPEGEILRRDLSLGRQYKPYRYLKISDGCNRGCNFCIIPSLRGRFQENSEENVLRDVRNAVAEGAKEICIVSQDTVFYGKSTERLGNLLREISLVEGVKILRPLYLYPDKKTFSLLDIFKEIPILAPYLESPIQHVSEKILKSMNRTGSPGFFRELFAKARELKPGLEIRTSIILGYPGESSEDVDAVLRFIQDVRPEKLALFSFSPQEGTNASSIQETVSQEEKAERVNLIREYHLEILKDIHINRIHKKYPAIVDSIKKGEAVVRRLQDAPEMDEVVYCNKGIFKPGDIGTVEILSFSEYDMEGSFTPAQNGGNS